MVISNIEPKKYKILECEIINSVKDQRPKRLNRENSYRVYCFKNVLDSQISL